MSRAESTLPVTGLTVRAMSPCCYCVHNRNGRRTQPDRIAVTRITRRTSSTLAVKWARSQA